MHFQCYYGVRIDVHSLLGGTSSTFDKLIRIYTGFGSALTVLDSYSKSYILLNFLSKFANISPKN